MKSVEEIEKLAQEQTEELRKLILSFLDEHEGQLIYPSDISKS